MISCGKEIVGIIVGVNDGSGVKVKMAERLGDIVGTIVFVVTTTGTGVNASAEQPASIPILKIAIRNIENLYLSFNVIPLYPIKTLRLTARVSRWWAGRDKTPRAGKARSQKNACKSRRIPPVGCTLC
jgi:hypothetical protein